MKSVPPTPSAAPLAPFRPRDWKVHPPLLHPPYRSTEARAPSRPLIPAAQTLSELTGPVYGREIVSPPDSDLTRNGAVNGEPLGERIVVFGRVLDENARPVPQTLVEIWQANAAGRYIHKREIHPAPLDPNFRGGGRTLTDSRGRYSFVTIRPGAYPWGNHRNAWRPAHIHFSLLGPAFAARLVTQMFFPGDPLLALDPIFNSADARARERLVAKFSIAETRPEWALAFEFNIVLRGRESSPTTG